MNDQPQLGTERGYQMQKTARCTSVLRTQRYATTQQDECKKLTEKSIQLNSETTAGRSDYREQLDLSTPQPLPTASDPLYWNLKAPNQWPSPVYLPEFRPVFEDYMERMSEISTFFTSLIAEALGMPPDAFDRFFDSNQQHKLKIVKYPEALTDSDDPLDRQGVGPHKDSMLTSYLLQASNQPGLQAQNTNGEWIDATPIDGTLVVAMGQGLEALTAGVCQSTTHRVLSPKKGQGARFSVPFFQGVSYDAKFEEMDVPESVRALRRNVLEKNGGRMDSVEFTFRKGRWGHLGEATLANRVKSHPDVGERWVSVHAPRPPQSIKPRSAENLWCNTYMPRGRPCLVCHISAIGR